jgi:hypothetical protein
MSMALTHFAVGAGATGLVVLVFLPRFQYARTLVLAGGVWAMIPDAHHVIPAHTGRLRALHDSGLMNLFWGHRYLDVVDPGDGAAAAAAAVGFMSVVTLLVEVRAARPLPAADSRRRPDAVHPAPPWFVVRGLLAALALVGGAALVAVAVVRVRYVGLLVAAGAILGLVGLELLTEDPRLRRLATRRVPAPVRSGTKVVVSVLGAAVVGGLLSTLPEFSDLSLSYAALALVVVVLVVRLWTPVLPAPSAGSEDGAGSTPGTEPDPAPRAGSAASAGGDPGDGSPDRGR